MALLTEVQIQKRAFGDYKKLTPDIYTKTTALARRLRGKKILHINSTQVGGGVSELLKSQVPLERSLGLKSSWFIIQAPLKFFAITKEIHNLLQGKPGSLSKKDKEFYLVWFARHIVPSCCNKIQQINPDILIIHDPQPLPLIEHPIGESIPVLRLHIDLSAPNRDILQFLTPLMLQYELVLVSNPAYGKSWIPKKKLEVVMPAIDPFTEKNKAMPKKKAQEIMALLGIRPEHPIIAQISRFDPWKDPLGVVEAYRIAKKKIPNLQLILAGISRASDDPEAAPLVRKVESYVRADKDIFLFSRRKQLRGIANAPFISAIYTASDVILQKSLKEGFGLTVSEAMWKEKAVIGGKTDGIALQIQHGKNGFLVSSPKEAGQQIILLLQDKSLRTYLGKAAKRTVTKKFLISRLTFDHIKIYSRLLFR